MVGGDPVEVECDWGLNGLRALARDRTVIEIAAGLDAEAGVPLLLENAFRLAR
jgi:hypothetical protein